MKISAAQQNFRKMRSGSIDDPVNLKRKPLQTFLSRGHVVAKSTAGAQTGKRFAFGHSPGCGATHLRTGAVNPTNHSRLKGVVKSMMFPTALASRTAKSGQNVNSRKSSC